MYKEGCVCVHMWPSFTFQMCFHHYTPRRETHLRPYSPHRWFPLMHWEEWGSTIVCVLYTTHHFAGGMPDKLCTWTCWWELTSTKQLFRSRDCWLAWHHHNIHSLVVVYIHIQGDYTYLVVGRILFTNKNMAFSLGKLILLLMMYMNCATVWERWMNCTWNCSTTQNSVFMRVCNHQMSTCHVQYHTPTHHTHS